MTTQPPPAALTMAELQIGLRLWDAFNFEKDSYAHDLEAPEIWLLENHQVLLAMARRLLELEGALEHCDRFIGQEGKAAFEAACARLGKRYDPLGVEVPIVERWLLTARELGWRPEGGDVP